MHKWGYFEIDCHRSFQRNGGNCCLFYDLFVLFSTGCLPVFSVFSFVLLLFQGFPSGQKFLEYCTKKALNFWWNVGYKLFENNETFWVIFAAWLQISVNRHRRRIFGFSHIIMLSWVELSRAELLTCMIAERKGARAARWAQWALSWPARQIHNLSGFLTLESRGGSFEPMLAYVWKSKQKKTCCW